MAEVRSGSFDTNVIYWSSTNRMFFRFSWSLSSQSTENNTSTISWTLQFLDLAAYTGNYRGTTDNWDGVIINGTRVLGKGIQGVFGNRWYYGNSKSGTLVIQHNDDGTKTFSVSVSIQSTNGDGWSGSRSYELPKIDVSKDMNIRLGDNVIKKAYVGTTEVKEVFYGDINIFPGYTRLEYIKTTGTQYIDTRVLPTKDINWSVDFMITQHGTSTYDIPFGSRATNAQNLLSMSTSQIAVDFGGTTLDLYNITQINNRILYELINPNENQVQRKINGTLISPIVNKSVFSGTNPYTMLIGGFHNNSASFESRNTNTQWYSVKIRNGLNLIRDFIPVKRKTDNKVGLYDLVEHKFYGNSGSGDFVAGPVV